MQNRPRPNRIFHITPTAHGIYALTTNGDIFYGYFIDKGPFVKTGWQWRKVPTVSQLAYEYTTEAEPTQTELEGIAATMRRQHEVKVKPWWKFW